jgi:hypothetical protein
LTYALSQVSEAANKPWNIRHISKSERFSKDGGLANVAISF